MTVELLDNQPFRKVVTSFFGTHPGSDLPPGIIYC
jgi:hypothetical protein